MDEIIDRKKPLLKIALFFVLGVSVLLFMVVQLQTPAGSSYVVDQNTLTLTQVKTKTLDNFIPFHASVVPFDTFYIDTVEGGKVINVAVEDGDMVELGATILNLSNSTLQLNVIESESELSQLLNNISNLELVISNDQLTHERNIIEYDFNITKLETELNRLKQLKKRGHINESEVEDVEIELNYWRSLRDFSKHAQARNKKLQNFQLSRLKSIYDVQAKNLALTKQSLDELIVKANATGQLSGFNVKNGQVLKKGERIGQVDDVSSFKLVGFLDEFYLEQVAVGQSALVRVEGSSVKHTVSKIFPDVRSGQFRIELTRFEGQYPSSIKRGQSFQGQIVVAELINAMVIPNGPFFQSTLGNWIFVWDPQSGVANKRFVELGVKTPIEIQVKSGLSEGEWVITSDYFKLKEFDNIIVSQ